MGINVLRLPIIVPCLFLSIASAELPAEAPPKQVKLAGGEILRVRPPNATVIATGDSIACWFQTGDVTIQPKRGKMLTVNGYICVRAEATGKLVYWTRSGGSTLINDAFMATQTSGGATIPTPLPSGQYQLVVMSFGHVDELQPELLDVSVTSFEVREEPKPKGTAQDEP